MFYKNTIKTLRELVTIIKTSGEEYLSKFKGNSTEISTKVSGFNEKYAQLSDENERLQNILNQTEQGITEKMRKLEDLVSRINDLNSAFDLKEAQYKDTIAALKAQNDELVKNGSSLEQYATLITSEKNEFIRNFFKEFAEKLENLSIYKSSNAQQGTTNDFKIQGATFYILPNGAHNSRYQNLIPSINKEGSGLELKIENSHMIPYTSEILEGSEIYDITQLKFFKLFIEKGMYQHAKEIAEECMNEKNEKQYTSVLMQYKDNHFVNEAFQNLKPKYRENANSS